MDIPVQIKSPNEEVTGSKVTVYNQKLGLCFCGNATTA
jgi:hypothetical protein